MVEKDRIDRIIMGFVIIFILVLAGRNTYVLETHNHEIDFESSDLYELLLLNDMWLGCEEYVQIEVLAYNVTCRNIWTTYCFQPDCDDDTEYQIITQNKDEANCGYNTMLSREPIITHINGDCIRYVIVGKGGIKI